MDEEIASALNQKRLKRTNSVMEDDITIHVDKLGFSGLNRETKSKEPLIWFVEVDCLITQARFRIRKRSVTMDNIWEIGASPVMNETEARLEISKKVWRETCDPRDRGFNLAFMNVLIWKCRGAAKDTFRSRFYRLNQEFNPDFVLLVETNVSLVNQSSYFHTLGFNATAASGPTGLAGGIWLLWKAPEVILQPVVVTSQVVHVTVQKQRYEEWLMSSIHGHPSNNMMWKNLSDITSSYAVPWLDTDVEWNHLLTKQERTSARRHVQWSWMERFADAIDVGTAGHSFTLTTARPPAPKCLWRQKYPEASAPHLPAEHVVCRCTIAIMPTSAIVVNVDGAARGSTGPTGFACIVRDGEGNWLEAYTGYKGETTHLMAKLMGILLGLRILFEKDYRYSVLESDCENALKIITEGIMEDQGIKKVVNECRYLIIQVNTTLKHIFREANRCAEFLANMALENFIKNQHEGAIGSKAEADHINVSSPPSALNTLLNNDIIGVRYERL